jgi:hypothetical protein
MVDWWTRFAKQSRLRTDSPTHIKAQAIRNTVWNRSTRDFEPELHSPFLQDVVRLHREPLVISTNMDWH